MKLVINLRKKNEKRCLHGETKKQHAIKNQWINDEIKEEIKNNETNDNENTSHIKSMGCNKSSSRREVHSDTGPS